MEYLYGVLDWSEGEGKPIEVKFADAVTDFKAGS